MFQKTLREGDRGPEVIVLKIYLFGAGLGHWIKLDQIYDDATFCAVSELRRILGLNSTGDEKSGDLDSEMVSAMKSRFNSDFDFVAACRAVNNQDPVEPPQQVSMTMDRPA